MPWCHWSGACTRSTLVPLSKRRCVTEWDALGLDPMEDCALSLTSGDDPGGFRGTELEVDMSSDEESSEAPASDWFCTDVSDRARERAQGSCLNALGWGTDCSTDVRDSRRRKGRRVIRLVLVAPSHQSMPLPRRMFPFLEQQATTTAQLYTVGGSWGVHLLGLPA